MLSASVRGVHDTGAAASRGPNASSRVSTYLTEAVPGAKMPLSQIGQFVMRITGGRSILCEVVEDLLVEARGALP